MSTLRDVAVDAYRDKLAAEQSGLRDEARAALTQVLTDPSGAVAFDPDDLVEQRMDTATRTVVVTADGGTLGLAVVDGQVFLAESVAGTWEPTGQRVDSLVELGALLEQQPA